MPTQHVLRQNAALALIELSCSLKCATDRDQDARSDEAGNQIADPTGEVNAEEAEQPASHSSPYDAEQDVHQNPFGSS
jgi:hypothetical protein